MTLQEVQAVLSARIKRESADVARTFNVDADVIEGAMMQGAEIALDFVHEISGTQTPEGTVQ